MSVKKWDAALQQYVSVEGGIDPAVLADVDANTAARHASGSDAETVTSMAALINSSDAITTPVDADKFGFRDSVSGMFAHVTWENIKATMRSYLEQFFTPEITCGFAGDLTIATGALRRYILAARTIKTIDANVGTAPSGGPVTVLIKKNGATINTITIADGTNRQAQTGLSLALAANDYLTFDRTAVNGAKDLTIVLRG